MESFIRFLVNTLSNPFDVMILLGFTTGIFIYFKKHKASRWTLAILVFFFFISSTRPVALVLASNLEDRYDPISLEQQRECAACNIIVLGAGHTADVALPASMQLSDAALARLTEGVRLWLLADSADLIVSGYGANESRLSQAEVLASAASQLGVDSSKILLQTKPTDTYEEAKYYKEHFDNGDTLIVVTSAMHMRRALYMFELMGIKVMAAPTDFRVKEDPDEHKPWLSFSAYNFELIHMALHEYVGIWYAKWKY